MKVWALGLAMALSGMAATAWAGDVTVNLTGIQPARGGKIYAGMQTREQFMQTTGVRGASLVPTGPSATLKFSDVPPGDYAISILHDTNGNRQMDTAPNGIPLEGWAIAGAGALDHKPTFDEVKITVPASGAAVSASMVYMDGKIPGHPGEH